MLRYSVCVALSFVTMASAIAHAQSGKLTARIAYAGLVDCDQPRQVKDHPFSGDGTMILSQDRSASLDMRMRGHLSSSLLKINTTLGNRPALAPGGTALLHVVSSNELQAVWTLPNNQVIVNMKASANACTLNIQFRLRGGARQYTIYDERGFYFCGKPRITSLSCSLR